MADTVSTTEVITISGPNLIAKAGIAATGVGLSYWTADDWIKILTIVFIGLQIVLLMPKLWQMISALARWRKVEVEIK